MPSRLGDEDSRVYVYIWIPLSRLRVMASSTTPQQRSSVCDWLKRYEWAAAASAAARGVQLVRQAHRLHLHLPSKTDTAKSPSLKNDEEATAVIYKASHRLLVCHTCVLHACSLISRGNFSFMMCTLPECGVEYGSTSVPQIVHPYLHTSQATRIILPW